MLKLYLSKNPTSSNTIVASNALYITETNNDKIESMILYYGKIDLDIRLIYRNVSTSISISKINYKLVTETSEKELKDLLLNLTNKNFSLFTKEELDIILEIIT